MDVDAYLLRNNLSIQKLSELTGFNVSSIHHWIAGTREMSLAAELHLQLLELYMTEHGRFPWVNEMTPREKRWSKQRREHLRKRK